MEIWRDIKGYEGLYQVSNLGRVKSLGNGCSNASKERILKPFIDNREGKGYLRVTLCKNGKTKRFQVHRLVAEAFIPNPNNLPFINHKSEIKSQNNVENLEWCDQKYNNSFGTRIERIVKANINHPNKSKPVLQYDLEGNFIKEWESTMEIDRQLGFAHTNISKCCKGKYKQAYGYIWRYKNG